jgi:SNF2-related domain
MPPASLPQLALPLGDEEDLSAEWHERLLNALADETKTSGFLAIAEQALLDWPGDAKILCFAATAALLDGEPERALVFLKRYSKRYIPSPPYHLLTALAADQQNKPVVARAILERHGLTSPYDAVRAFPAGWERRHWLNKRLANILGNPGRKPAAVVAGRTKAALAPKAAVKQAAKPAVKAAKTAPKSVTPPPAPAVPVPAATADIAAEPAGIPRIEINIPLATAFNLAPLLAAAAGTPDHDGAWYRLRERFAHLGLAQGFDELLCLPHLQGIETFWYQIETVRKVLKQFRGRVLLADEVGLGKTIEAGMVLKEYLLRGMVEHVLVLTPASLVGQWREELETKSISRAPPLTMRCFATIQTRSGARSA